MFNSPICDFKINPNSIADKKNTNDIKYDLNGVIFKISPHFTNNIFQSGIYKNLLKYNLLRKLFLI